MRTIFLLVALIAGYVATAQSPGTGQRIGYANMEYIIGLLPEMKKIEADLSATQTQLRNQIQAKSKEVEKEYTDFNANMNNMADTVRMNRQRDLEQSMADLEKMQQDAQTSLQNKQKLFMAPIYLQVHRAIEEVAKENGFAVILTERIGDYSFLIYQDKQKDVSPLVLEKFGVTVPEEESKP